VFVGIQWIPAENGNIQEMKTWPAEGIKSHEVGPKKILALTA